MASRSCLICRSPMGCIFEVYPPKYPAIAAITQCDKRCWTSLHSGRSPPDGGQRFCTLALSLKSHGFSEYCKADVCTINVIVAVVASRRIILQLLLRYRRVMAYVASRRMILLLLCLVGRVIPFMASRRVTLLLRLCSLRWTMVI